MTVTAAQLRAVSEGLTLLGRDLGLYGSYMAGVNELSSGDLDRIGTSWKGPRSDAVVGAGRDYLGAVKGYSGALESASGTVDGWATSAGGFATYLAVQEQVINDFVDQGPSAYSQEAVDDLRHAQNTMAELTGQWQRVCVTFASELTAALDEIYGCGDAVALAVGEEYARAIASMPAGGDPTAIGVWWANLAPMEKVAVAARMPVGLGALDGVPAWVRNVVNRNALAADIARLGAEEQAGTLTRIERRVLENLRSVRSVLLDHAGTKDPITDQPVITQLYIYAPAAFNGDGRIAISIGDLDTARHVAVTVPGMMSDASGLGAGRVQNIYEESRWASGGESVAVLDWMGYNAPNFNPTSGGGVGETFGDLWDEAVDVGDVAERNLAVAGAQHLSVDVYGLRSMRSSDPHLTVIGNSYGSTTSAIAADQHGLDADDLILSGSPGAGFADHVDDFTTGSENTWIASASRDAVTSLGESGGRDPADAFADLMPGVEQMGNDPSEDAFGANRFQAESVDRGDHWNIGDHGRYYDQNSESLYNVAAVVTGEYDLVVDADPRHKEPFAETHNPVEFHGGVRRGMFGLPVIEFGIETHHPVEINVWPDDPEGDRDPGYMTHAPEADAGVTSGGGGGGSGSW